MSNKNNKDEIRNPYRESRLVEDVPSIAGVSTLSFFMLIFTFVGIFLSYGEYKCTKKHEHSKKSECVRMKDIDDEAKK